MPPPPALLARLPALRNAPPESLRELDPLWSPLHALPGHRISARGEPVDRLLVILAGAIAEVGPNGQRIVHGTGGLAGVRALLPPTPAPHDLVVHRPTRAIALRREALSDLLARHHPVAHLLLARAAETQVAAMRALLRRTAPPTGPRLLPPPPRPRWRRPVLGEPVDPEWLEATLHRFLGRPPHPALVAAFRPIRRPSGSLLFDAGGPGSAALLLARGEAVLVRRTGEERRVVGIAGPGGFLGLPALLHPGPRLLGAVTRTPLTAHAISRAALDRLPPPAARPFRLAALERLCALAADGTARAARAPGDPRSLLAMAGVSPRLARIAA